jgi:cyclophilin family peptidyl-prolyl cis-trans isomerase
MTKSTQITVACWAVLTLVSALEAQERQQEGLRAAINARSRTVSVGKPVWIEFTISNESDEPVALQVAGTRPGPDQPLVGLPVAHVFSGKAFSGLTIDSMSINRSWDVPMYYQPPEQAPELMLAPHGSVGSWVEVSRYYPALSTPGRYRLQWKPYEGALTSNILILEIAPLKQAVIATDFGEMTVQFFYEEAPIAVANFIELARSGFYNGLGFHRIWPGILIQGGDPIGDGTGIHPDGRKLPAEFSDRPQTRGMVSMARLESDPDSASCQFFILCNNRMPQWDGRYTIFGQLVGEESFATLDKLMGQPVHEDGRPKAQVYIRSVRIENEPGGRGFGAPSAAPPPTAPTELNR